MRVVKKLEKKVPDNRKIACKGDISVHFTKIFSLHDGLIRCTLKPDIKKSRNQSSHPGNFSGKDFSRKCREHLKVWHSNFFESLKSHVDAGTAELFIADNFEKTPRQSLELEP